MGSRGLLAFTVAALAAILVSVFALAWFHVDLELSGQVKEVAQLGTSSRFEIGLHSMQLCTGLGVCISYELSRFDGPYPTLALITFYASIGLAALVTIQGGIRLISGQQANSTISHLGIGAALICFVTAGLAGYVFHPNGFTSEFAAVAVHRTWAPALAMVGYVAAIQALRLAMAELDMPTSRSAAHAQPYDRRSRPSMAPRNTGAPTRQRVESIPISAMDPDPDLAAVTGPSGHDAFAPPPARGAIAPPAAHDPFAPPPAGAATSRAAPRVAPNPIAIADTLIAPPAPAPVATADAALPQVRFAPTAEQRPVAAAAPAAAPRNALKFATARIALGEVGIAGEQEDGNICRAAWTGLVGVIARRLPPIAPYDGDTIIDLVSTAGATMRITQRTEISGASPEGTGSERARSLVQLIAVRCPKVKLDAATRAFATGTDAAL